MGLSVKPEDAGTGGGFGNGPCTIVSARTGYNDYGGTREGSTCLDLTCQFDERQEPDSIKLSVGSVVVPNDEGRQFKCPNSDMEGSYQLPESSGVMKFFLSLSEARGPNGEEFDLGSLQESFEPLEGLRILMSRQKVKMDNSDREIWETRAESILGMPEESKPKRTRKKRTPRPKAAAAKASGSEEVPREVCEGLIAGVFGDKTEMSKSNFMVGLRKAVNQAQTDEDKARGAAVMRIVKDDADGLVTSEQGDDGEMLTLNASSEDDDTFE
ncbi:MAG: hypothetical protein ACYTEQ_01200 [Planctomycetota bacterium]|jgi:hypothetical protein